MCAGLERWLISRKKDQVGVLINQINIQLIHHEIMRMRIVDNSLLAAALQLQPLRLTAVGEVRRLMITMIMITDHRITDMRRSL